MDTRTRFFVFEGELFRLCGVFYVLCFFVERESCVVAVARLGGDEGRGWFLI